ncbi:MAG: hypothetical protein EOO42_21820, partial [Flavobacteriales bacterium]
MKNKYSILFLLYLILTSCSEQDAYFEGTTMIKSKNLTIDTTVLSITLSKGLQPIYKIASFGNDGVFCGYNPKSKKIDLFSLVKKVYIRSIVIQIPEGQNISDVLSIEYFNENCIFILTRRNIIAVDSKGNIRRKISINDNQTFFNQNHFREIDAGKNFFFNETNGKLYVTNYAFNVGFRNKEFYRTPIIAEVDTISPNKMNTVPVYYSKLYLKNYYGFMSFSQQR